MTDKTEWRKRTDESGDRNYQYFREMFPELDDQIIDQFKLGFGATIIYENMSREEIGKLIYNAIAIGFVSGQQQSAAASAVWDQAVEACAQKADYWGNGGFVVQEEPGRSRYSLRDLQTYTNVTGRGIAEDIRSLKRATDEK